VKYRSVRRLAAATLAVGTLAAQDAAGSRASADAVAEARSKLKEVMQAYAGAASLAADYVQERSTALVKRPLVSKGRMIFRRDPGCVVFFVDEPRRAVVRLDSRHYEVYRPEQKRLERFVLASDELPRMLFQALSPDPAWLAAEDAQQQAGTLDQAFEIAGCEAVAGEPARTRITLVPRSDAARKGFATRLELTVDSEQKRLVGFAFRDPQGDDVRVELSGVQLAPELATDAFDLALPADVQTIVHHLPPAGGGSDARPRRGPQRQGL
jgi:outer membrane lipoprotein-sorting protein